MALYCVISAGGSPGVTTTALALALTWPCEVVLAECDPAGRRVLAGFMAERLRHPPGPGLLGLAMAVGHAPQDAAALDDYVIPLTDDGGAVLVHGVRDPRHARQLTPLWEPLAKTFAAAGTDVIADLGRVGGPDTPFPVLAEADLVVMVLRRSLAQVDAAQPRLAALREGLSDGTPVVLCLIDDGAYSTAAVQKALFALPVIAELPHVPADAGVLSDGAQPRAAFRTSLLMRAAGHLGQRVRRTVEERAFRVDAVGLQPPSFGGGR
jgi:hypothetical protein